MQRGPPNRLHLRIFNSPITNSPNRSNAALTSGTTPTRNPNSPTSSAPRLLRLANGADFGAASLAQEGQWVACGSKGFSRENCEVKLFDLRGASVRTGTRHSAIGAAATPSGQNPPQKKRVRFSEKEEA